MNLAKGFYPLIGKVHHYSWGGYNFIPELIRVAPSANTPYAEYWLGAHDRAPSELLLKDGTTIPLNEVINDQAEKALGAPVAQRFGRLPYLLKVLDVREMLSIQLHPTKSQAENGFARENSLGIALDAAERNYKDDNHKPELTVALSDFWLLHGFRPAEQLQRLFDEVPELRSLKPIFDTHGYSGLYRYVMEMPSALAESILDPLTRRMLQTYEAGELTEMSADYWLAKAVQRNDVDRRDRGLFAIYCLNLVHLKPGQAIFQDAGTPHAYLKGQTLEIMANSDNVIRGGLTPKHVDIAQLLSLVNFRSVSPEAIEASQSGNPHEFFYASPSVEFLLSKISLAAGDTYKGTTYSAEIVLNLHDDVMLRSEKGESVLSQGQSAVLFSSTKFELEALGQSVVVYKASVPNPAHWDLAVHQIPSNADV
jgi:mannose-6-phosphate isomerase